MINLYYLLYYPGEGFFIIPPPRKRIGVMAGGLSKGYKKHVFVCPEVNGASLMREVSEYNLKIDPVTAGVKLAT